MSTQSRLEELKEQYITIEKAQEVLANYEANMFDLEEDELDEMFLLRTLTANWE